MSGQLAIKWIEQKLNEHFNTMLKTKDLDYVIASDTDSIYLNLGGLVKKFIPDSSDKVKTIRMLDKFCEDKIQPFIDKSYQELADYTNAYAQKMKMKREALSDKGIWCAKKRYLINVYNNEGVEYEKPKLKIVGLDAIKSSTPQVCRQKIKEAYDVIIQKDQEAMIDFVSKFREQYSSLSSEIIAFPRGVNGLGKYADENSVYGFKTPVHVKGSLYFNHFIDQYKLNKKYQKIKEGDKIKFIYLKEPNPIQSPVISFLNVIPKEFDLQNYLDYNSMFEKSFIEPIKEVLNAINWKVERTNSLEDFFC